MKFNNLYLIAQSSVKFRGKPLRMCTLSCKATVKVANESVLRSMQCIPLKKKKKVEKNKKKQNTDLAKQGKIARNI